MSRCYSAKTLPKWAQRMIEQQQQEIDRLKSLNHDLTAVFSHDWFTIGPSKRDMKLYYLTENDALPVASLGAGDVMVIGRKKVLE